MFDCFTSQKMQHTCDIHRTKPIYRSIDTMLDIGSNICDVYCLVCTGQ